MYNIFNDIKSLGPKITELAPSPYIPPVKKAEEVTYIPEPKPKKETIPITPPIQAKKQGSQVIEYNIKTKKKKDYIVSDQLI
mgnify:CR=1 FL=1